jgi:hypothetical protein
MIKAEELRLGNLVLYKGFACMVIGIGSVSVQLRDMQDYSPIVDRTMFVINNISLDKISPVLLTEEWLVRLGGIEVMSSIYKSYNLHGIQLSYINGMWIEYVHQVEIKGVHHLQNFYYFTKGQELEIPRL